MRQAHFPNWKASKRIFTEEINYYQLQKKFDLGIIYIELLHAILKCSQLSKMNMINFEIVHSVLVLVSTRNREIMSKRKNCQKVHKNGCILM